MKRTLALALTLALTLGLCACGSTGDSSGGSSGGENSNTTNGSITLRFAFSEAPESQAAQVMEGVKERIEERTEGRVTVEPHWSNELGPINDCIEQITMGGNMVVSTSASSWAPYGCEDLTALDSMFAFSSTEEISNFNNSDMWKSMVEEMKTNGNIHLICMNWAAAPRVVMSKKPINSVADMEGMLIRVATETYTAWFDALGASPVSGIPFAEVYTNIESGVIEGAEATFATLSDYSVQEVAKYAFTSNHTYAVACLGTSTEIWNQISPEDQAVVEEEITAGGEEYTKLCAESNKEYIQMFKEAGVTIVDPSEEDIAAMQEAAAEAAVTLGLRDGVLDEIKAASAG